MLNIRKFAAIDIGSNAVRLLISNIIEEEGQEVRFKKSSLVRVPVRLGVDAFIHQEISEENNMRLQDTMMAFKLLMTAHRVERYKACATSAMREAVNGKEVAYQVFKNTEIEIDIIDGNEEAAIIAATDISEYINPNKNYLYVDVGGGSTEFTIIHDSKKVTSQSFKIGTVRLLHNIVEQSSWLELEHWIKLHTSEYEHLEVIGSGGNINKIYKLSEKSIGEPLTYFYLSSLYHTFNNYSYEQRITKLDLNQDRADVIIPALRIYLSAMKWSGAKHIFVPKIGLADGIIKSLYFDTVPGNEL